MNWGFTPDILLRKDITTGANANPLPPMFTANKFVIIFEVLFPSTANLFRSNSYRQWSCQLLLRAKKAPMRRTDLTEGWVPERQPLIGSSSKIKRSWGCWDGKIQAVKAWLQEQFSTNSSLPLSTKRDSVSSFSIFSKKRLKLLHDSVLLLS